MASIGKSIVEAEESLIEIPIYCRTLTNKNGSERTEVLDAEEAEKILAGEDEEAKAKIEVINTKWKYATWKVQNDILKQSLKPSQNGAEPEFDWNKYRDIRVKKLLYSWDLTYDNQKIPVSADVLDRVPPQFFVGLFDSYEKHVGFTEDEKGKS